MKTIISKFAIVLFVAVSVLSISTLFTSCGDSGNDVTITGAGSSFDNPLFTKMFADYYANNKLQVNYQSIGSGAGIKQLLEKTIDFGASDAIMKEEQEKEAGVSILHIPITSGAVVLSYNVEGLSAPLNLDATVIAEMFLGKITKWNDAKIAALNPEVKLPDTKIEIAHRSDGSGTTDIFTNYLATTNNEWKEKVGAGKSVNWPAGLGSKGNEGVSGLIKNTPGAIGYIELNYAIQNKMPYANVKNLAGKFITASTESVTAAANIEMPADGKVMLVNSAAPDGYPLSSFSWVLIYKEQKYNNRSEAKATALVNLLHWMINDGQKFSKDLDYAPLSAATTKVGEDLLKSVTYEGRSVLK